ncbi:hypothetical protein HK413_03000 [Mucilaginibacter sp. S1162]|uniref:L,D-transpeptidase scaffold domain-containing protein n=1 Tax=Mucilaginibacter humi TaxID=2732510 RepID=A0ABX1VZJ9_9SPHI|nr:hypothetical protein [Mucilaginibacter humi]NNU33384.1 hypothetical protein [Mucilaginibacter humi]
MKKTMRSKKVIYRLLCLAPLLLFLSSPACSQLPPARGNKAASLRSNRDQTTPNAFNQVQPAFDSIRIARFMLTYTAFKPYAAVIHAFYSHRQYAYAWFDHGQLIEQASNLVNRVLNPEMEGLNQHAPYERQLDSLMFTGSATNTELELMLTAQYFVFAKTAGQARMWHSAVPSIGTCRVKRSIMNNTGYVARCTFDQPRRQGSRISPI